VITNLFAVLNKQGKSVSESPITAEQMGQLLDLQANNTISGRLAKDVFEVMAETGMDPARIVKERGLEQITDTGAIEAAVQNVIEAHPEQVAQYRAGGEKVLGWLVGQVMRQTKGKANPAQATEILKAKLGA
jgi:aspartyl-tRNA(Asn)/glutamyl-tRNA(Gln) amidotransferase subunit B